MRKIFSIFDPLKKRFLAKLQPKIPLNILKPLICSESEITFFTGNRNPEVVIFEISFLKIGLQI